MILPLLRRSLPLLAVVLLLSCAVLADEPRLAIIATEETRDLAALLEATLSKKQGLHLLERESLLAIADERRLAEMALADSRHLGTLLGADGLLFINKSGEETRASLTAVHLGFIVTDWQFPANALLPEVAASMANALELYRTKLQLTEAVVIPLSMLNLRAELSSPRSTEIERTLTRLLESRLIRLPEVILLERRRAGAIQLEQALQSESQPELLRGKWVLDGSLSISEDSLQITATLRLRSPHGGAPLVLERQGDNLPALVEALASTIAQKLNTPLPPASETAALQEAREYLLEGLWASRRGLAQEAIEAIDSAEFLGETAPDLHAIRIPVLCRLAVGPKRAVNDWAPLPDDPAPERRIEALQRAMGDLSALRARRGSRAEVLKGRQRIRDLDELVIDSCSRLLVMMERTRHPATPSFREALRDIAGFAPLAGKLPEQWESGLAYAGHWAHSQEEEIAYYRLIATTAPWAHYQVWRMQLHFPKDFCARFIPDEKERLAAYHRFLDTIGQEPLGAPVAHFLRAHSAPPDRLPALSERLYEHLWSHREELLATKRLVYLLRYSVALEKKQQKKMASPTVIRLIRYLLQNDERFVDASAGCWAPELFPPEEAPTLWADFLAYEQRVLANGAGGGFFPSMKADYIRLFGDPQAATLPQPLEVTQFWHPEGLKEMLHTRSIQVTQDGVRLIGATLSGEKKIRVYEVALPSMEATLFKSPEMGYPYGCAEVGKTLLIPGQRYIKSGEEWLSENLMFEYNRSTDAWGTHPIQAGVQEITTVGGQCYVTIRQSVAGNWESGIGIYDTQAHQLRIIASSRRKPAINQFDDRKDYSLGPIFAGPAGQPCVLIEHKAYEIREGAGEWPLLADLGFLKKIDTSPGTTLVFGTMYGALKKATDVVFGIGSQQEEPPSAPTLWLGTAPNPNRKAPLPEWAAAYRWEAQPGYRFACQSYTQRGGDLIGLVVGGEDQRSAHLLYYRNGKAHPALVPLKFSMPGEAKAAILAIDPDMKSSNSTSRMVIAPLQDHPSYLKMVSTPSGLCFKAFAHGFWFLPYEKLDAYLATAPEGVSPHPAPSRDASKPKTNPFNEIDPANLNSF